MRLPMAARKLLIKAWTFDAWLKRMGWTNSQAGLKLGTSRNSIAAWREHGAPYYIGIAAAALELGNGYAYNIHRTTDVQQIRAQIDA